LKNLHLGCFDQAIEGWFNTDVTPHLFVARVPLAAAVLRRFGLMTRERYEQHRRGVFDGVRYLNLAKRFPFADGSFDNAFSAHVLEHLYPEQAVSCVREVRRVLKVGGVFRVTVPDLDRAVEAYDPDRPEMLLDLIYNTGQKRDKNRHHWMYSERSLRRLLLEAGFAEAHRRAFGEGRCPDLDCLDNRAEESLFMEGVK
jgi:predicted SAM-dependent methyltransferase